MQEVLVWPDRQRLRNRSPASQPASEPAYRSASVAVTPAPAALCSAVLLYCLPLPPLCGHHTAQGLNAWHAISRVDGPLSLESWHRHVYHASATSRFTAHDPPMHAGIMGKTNGRTLAGFLKAARSGTRVESTITIMDSVHGDVTFTKNGPIVPPRGGGDAAGTGDGDGVGAAAEAVGGPDDHEGEPMDEGDGAMGEAG